MTLPVVISNKQIKLILLLWQATLLNAEKMNEEKVEMLTTICLFTESEQNTRTKKVASCETVIFQVLMMYL
jgi:hypothetical protein